MRCPVMWDCWMIRGNPPTGYAISKTLLADANVAYIMRLAGESTGNSRWPALYPDPGRGTASLGEQTCCNSIWQTLWSRGPRESEIWANSVLNPQFGQKTHYGWSHALASRISSQHPSTDVCQVLIYHQDSPLQLAALPANGCARGVSFSFILFLAG